MVFASPVFLFLFFPAFLLLYRLIPAKARCYWILAASLFFYFWGEPSYLLLMGATDNYGVYHCTNNGICSWYDFTCEILRLSGIDAECAPCTTEEYPTPAARPAYSALDNMMLRLTVGDHMRPWQEAIAEYIKNLPELGD